MEFLQKRQLDITIVTFRLFGLQDIMYEMKIYFYIVQDIFNLQDFVMTFDVVTMVTVRLSSSLLFS